MEYAIQYGDHLVRDSSWGCVADVIATYHGSGYVAPDGRVTGVLVCRPLGSDEWLVVK